MNVAASAADARKSNLVAWARVLWRALSAKEPHQVRVLSRRELLPSTFPGINLVVSPQYRWLPLAACWTAAHQADKQPSIRCRDSLQGLLGSAMDVTDIEAELPDALEAPWAVLMDGDDGALALTAPLASLDQLLAPEPQSGVLWIPAALPESMPEPMLARVVPSTAAIFAGPLGLWSGHFTPDEDGGTFLPVQRVDETPVHRLRFAAALHGAHGDPSRRCLPDSQGVSEGYERASQATWLRSANGVWAIEVTPLPR